MDEIAYFAYNSETGEHLEVLPFDECIKIIQYRYNNIKESLNNACETNKRLKEEHYKDELVNGLKKQLSRMEDAYYRGFPITKKEEDSINAWKKKHDEEDHGYDTFEKRLKAEGVSGGRYSYHFYPTAIGTSGVIRCSCGAEFEFMEW